MKLSKLESTVYECILADENKRIITVGHGSQAELLFDPYSENEIQIENLGVTESEVYDACVRLQELGLLRLAYTDGRDFIALTPVEIARHKRRHKPKK